MKLENYTYYYFLGIGGIGMSALARYFNQFENAVLGYDKTETPLTQKLQKEGISISFVDEISSIPKEIHAENTLVVYTPAIPKDSVLLNFFQENNFTLAKRSVVLGEITQATKCLAIAGTHGKTTTTTLLAYLLHASEFPSMALLGGISENYQTNFLFQKEDYSVVEADEFDRSFLTLKPYFACITSMDADHLDIYGTDDQIKQGFKDFANLVDTNGQLFLKKGLEIDQKHLTYSVDEEADYYAHSIEYTFPYSTFSLQTPKGNIVGFEISILGKHNIENATVALAMALELGVSEDKLIKALKSFKGIKRRFTTHFFENQKVYIDDYAHHPTEINAALQAVQEICNPEETLVVFQPHLFSRTKDFADDFAQSLSQFPNVLLLDIYPARELPIEGITSDWLASKMTNNVSVSSLENAMENIFKQNFKNIVTLGAGNIDTLSSQIIKKLEA